MRRAAERVLAREIVLAWEIVLARGFAIGRGVMPPTTQALTIRGNRCAGGTGRA